MIMAAVVFIGVWDDLRPIPYLVRLREHHFIWVETHRRVLYLEMLLTAGGLVGTVYIVYWISARIKPPPRPDYRLIKVMLATWSLIVCFDTISYLQKRDFYEQLRVRHPTEFYLHVRADLVAVLFLVGAGLYWFKRKSKLYYGLSEVGIALISNFRLVRGIIDVSRPKLFEISRDDAILIGVFTYLLGRGIGNVVEGLDERELKRLATPVANA